MRNKIVLWGNNASDERILVALELKTAENKVMVYTFPEKIATDDFYQQMMEQWRNDKEEVTFPEGHQSLVRELSITESLLPEDIKVQRADVVQRAQTEWHFIVLSSKLSEAYRSELADLEEKLSGLKEYNKELWGNLKQFWGKVQQQIQDRTLLREHADELRTRTNKAFEEMKGLRSKMDEAFRETSKQNVERFEGLLTDVESRIKENKHLSRVFEDLKKLQKELRGFSFTKEDRNKMWQRIDSAFKVVKEQRFGEKANSGNSALDRINSRYNGLIGALEKMERSIKRDEDDLAFQARKIDRTDGQLEAQIRQAKIQMIQQRVDSKREKLADMLSTKTQLEAKIKKEKERQAKREEQQRKDAARKEAQAKAKEKIAEDIRQKQEVSEEDAAKLAAAADAINTQKQKKGKAKPETKEETSASADSKATEGAPSESLLSAIGTTLSESLEDVVDTVKAVAEVVGQQIEEKVEEIKKDISEATTSAEEE